MLPSQVTRASGWKSSSRAGSVGGFAGVLRKGNLWPRLVWLGVAGAVVVLAITVWSKLTAPGGGGPAMEDLAGQRAAVPPGGVSEVPSTKPAAPPAVPVAGREPTAVEMGKPGGVGGDRYALVPNPPSPLPHAQPAPNAPPASAPLVGPGAGDGFKDVRDLVDAANKAMSAGRLVEARTLLNNALMTASLPPSERAAIRQQIQGIQDNLIFGTQAAPGDPYTDWYTVVQGDSLVKIMQKQSLPPDWRLLQRINRMARPGDLHAGQRLKVVRTPFHAVVHKNDFRMDVYIGDPLPPGVGRGSRVGPDGQEDGWTFVHSFRVGLGETNGTPEGTFVVRPRSKMVNPRWVNPRTGEKFEADDPKNPLGEFWIGLDGADEGTKKFVQYGIHGTIEPESIGQQRSMGCVRMLPDDIALVYEMLSERLSTVKIVP